MQLEDVRPIIHEIRNQVQVLQTASELNALRLDNVEKLLNEHHVAYVQQKNDMTQLMSMMERIKQQAAVKAFIKECAAWLGGAITVIASAWPMIERILP